VTSSAASHFVERGGADPASGGDPTDSGIWSFDRTDLDDPEPVPAGTVASSAGAERVWSLPDEEPVDAESGQAAVDEALGAVLGEIKTEANRNDLAVAFSGGIDSGVVAAAVPDAPCYVAGFEGCHDIEAAREAATAMELDLRVVEITHDDLVRAVGAVAAATGRRNPMDVAIAVPLYLAAEAAATDGIDRLAVGQGADELFGGYSKVVNPAGDDRVAAETVRGARTETVRTLPEQLDRDVLAPAPPGSSRSRRSWTTGSLRPRSRCRANCSRATTSARSRSGGRQPIECRSRSGRPTRRRSSTARTSRERSTGSRGGGGSSDAWTTTSGSTSTRCWRSSRRGPSGAKNGP